MGRSAIVGIHDHEKKSRVSEFLTAKDIIRNLPSQSPTRSAAKTHGRVRQQGSSRETRRDLERCLEVPLETVAHSRLETDRHGRPVGLGEEIVGHITLQIPQCVAACYPRRPKES